MAMTDTRPDTDAPAAASTAAEAADVEVVLGTGDHKTIGRLWIAVSSLYLVAALVVAVVAGAERIDLDGFAIVEDAEMYAQLWSAAREALLVLGVVPLLVGIATYIVPLQIGASTLAFPRGAAAAFWTWLVSGALLVASFVLNGGPGGGRQDFTALWAVSLGAVLVALAWALICIVTTILGLRTQGMTLPRTPTSTWSFLVFGTIGLATLPILVAELVVAWIRVRYGDLDAGTARLALVQVIDGISLAPGVFWLAIPVLGLAGDAIATHAGSPLRQHRAVLGLIAAFGALAFGGHLLSFLTLRAVPPFDNGVLVVQLLLVPLVLLAATGLIADSVRRGRFRFRAAPVGALVALALLVLASLVVVLGQVQHVLTFIEDLFDQSIDVPTWLQLTGTSYHDGVRVLVAGSALLAAVAAVHHWGQKFYGRALDEVFGVLSVGAIALGTAVWGIAEVVAGTLEQRREPALDPGVQDAVEILNAISMVGAGVLALGVLGVVANLAVSTVARRGTATELWRGSTLEWATASPPPLGNFPQPPVVASATPLADPLPEEEVAR